MKNPSIITLIAAICCITLTVACGQKRDNYGTYRGGAGGHCSPQSYSQYDRGYGYDRGYDRGYDNYGSSSRYGQDPRYGSTYGHRGGSPYIDPTCTGGIQPYPTGAPYNPNGCGNMYGQGYRSARHHQYSGSWCVQGSFGFGDPYYRAIDTGSGEALLCNLNENPGAACPQGLTCQGIGEGDTGICL